MPKKEHWSQTSQALWNKRNPWSRYLEYARRRCNDTDPDGFWPRYGAKGIKCLLTGQEIKEIWFRDKARDLKKPSLDRIDSGGNYEKSNVRFIEFAFNARLAWDPAARSADSSTIPEFA